MMNTDGSTNVLAQTRFGVSLPDSTALWSLVIGAGVVIRGHRRGRGGRGFPSGSN